MTVLDTIIELLGKNPKGMLSREVADELGYNSASFASKYLDRGVVKGSIWKIAERRGSKNGGGRTMRYFLPQHWQSAVEENAIQIRKIEKQSRDAATARQRERRKRVAARQNEIDDDAKNYFTHTIIPASQTTAPKAGPRWVSDLA